MDLRVQEVQVGLVVLMAQLFLADLDSLEILVDLVDLVVLEDLVELVDRVAQVVRVYPRDLEIPEVLFI